MERLTDKSTYSNFTEVYATHFNINVELDFTRKVLCGVVTHTLKVAEGVKTNTYIVDTRVLSISGVRDVDNKDIHWSYGQESSAFGRALIVEFPQPIVDGQKVVFHYETASGHDCAGALFLEPSQTADKTHPFYFTQGQAILTRSIMPCQDTPSRKVTYDATVIVPKSLTAVMSATSIGSSVHPKDSNKIIFMFEQRVCMATYLITIAAGLIKRKELSRRCAVWAEPSVIDKAAWEFANMDKMLQSAETLCGPYVWGRYDVIVLPPAFPYGGMENPQLTFVSPTIITGDRSRVNVVIHEIAHSWSGNLVTNASWDDFWLNEGFTVFTERAVLLALEGHDAFHVHAELGWRDLEATVTEEFSPSHDFTKLRPCLHGVDPDEAFSKIPYEKGFALLLNLQQALYPGKDARALYPFLRHWFEKFSYKTVDFNDFKETLEDYFGKNVDAASTEEAARKVEVIKNFNWAKWVTEPGMAPQKPIIDERPVEWALDLAERYAKNPNENSFLNAADREKLVNANPDLVLLFLQSLRQKQINSKHFDMFTNRFSISAPQQADLDALLEKRKSEQDKLELPLDKSNMVHLDHPCKVLDAEFNFSQELNPDILHEWMMFAVQLDYQPIKKSIFKFLGAQGRIKYVKPLFQVLMKGTALFRNLAREAFHSHVGKYHAVLARMVAEVVGIPLANARGENYLQRNPFHIHQFEVANAAHVLPELPEAIRMRIESVDAANNVTVSAQQKEARDRALRFILAAHPDMDLAKLTPIGIPVEVDEYGRPLIKEQEAMNKLPEGFAVVFPTSIPIPVEATNASQVQFGKGSPSTVDFTSVPSSGKKVCC